MEEEVDELGDLKLIDCDRWDDPRQRVALS
jgi:hypothetical protein